MAGLVGKPAEELLGVKVLTDFDEILYKGLC
jgi:hypothetical protein